MPKKWHEWVAEYQNRTLVALEAKDVEAAELALNQGGYVLSITRPSKTKARYEELHRRLWKRVTSELWVTVELPVVRPPA